MKKGLHILLFAAVCLCMAAGVHFAQEFRFYNIESNDLFLYDWADIWSKLCGTGGLATLLASFLTQFMRIPFVGTVIVSGIYMLTVYLLYKILDRRADAAAMAGFCLLPAVFLFLCMENDYYRFQGHMAFLLMVMALFAYVSVSKEKLRYLSGFVIIPLLYHAAGSVAVAFVASAVVWEMRGSGLKGLKSIVYLAVLAALAYVYVRYSLVSSVEHALTPFMYYDWPSTYFFPVYAWSMVPLMILAAWILSKVDMKQSYKKTVAIAGLVFSFFLAVNFYGQVHSRSYYRLIQEQYWAENEDWDRIIRTADRRQPTFLISYLNLALAQKGLLVQNYKYYNPQDLAYIM